MPRQEFSRKTKAARFLHCGSKCEGCGVKLTKTPHYDHDTPTGWLGGDNSFDNCRVLCVACHREKTAAEAPIKAKGDRIRDKLIGALTPRPKIISPGFRKAPPQRKASTPLSRPLPPRRIPT